MAKVSAAAAQARARIAAAQERLASGLREGEGGVALLDRYSREVASLVADMSREAIDRASRHVGRLALGAIGALGRGELGPHSDVDLVLVCESAPPQGDSKFDEFVRELVHPLWDAGLRANVLVHDMASWFAGADEDLTVATALLDLTCLVGEPRVLSAVREQGFARYFGEKRGKFLERLGEEIEERHARYGGTVFVVEPDLKFGPGGLRDLATVEWSLIATHGTMDLVELAREEFVRPRLAAVLTNSRDVLLRLRAALQLAAKRPQERLVFQYQELLPPLLGLLPDTDVSDEVLVAAVEAAMQDYYRAARDLVRYGRRLRERCRPTPDAEHQPAARRIDERFSIRDGRLIHDEADLFAERPVLALEALLVAQRAGVELSGGTFDAIAEASALPGATALVDEPEAQRRLLDLLCDPSDISGTLENAAELRLVERVLPEFGPIRGRMQHDAYHVYTVDQHTFNAIAMLKRLARGEHNKDFPLATALHLDIDDPRVLYLATLVHDTGKGIAGDQCETGSAIALEVATRAGLGDAQAKRCSLLVREHLTMPLLSQKRDLSDPLLIEAFAKTVGDAATLKELYLLSLVDTAQVRPGNLTSWKLTLLDELYLQTMAHLRSRPSAVSPPAEANGEPTGMPARYYSLYHHDMRRAHGALVERMMAEERAAIVDLEPGSGALRLTLVARDRPGLLTQAIATLNEHGAELMAADVFSSTGPNPIVVDVFRIEAREGPERGMDAETETAIEQALQRGVPKAELQAPPPKRQARKWRQYPRIPTRIAFERDPAGERTIVEVETQAGPDVLRRITLAFAAEGIEILLARCNTEAERAANVFYVATRSPEEQKALADRLRTYLEAA